MRLLPRTATRALATRLAVTAAFLLIPVQIAGQHLQTTAPPPGGVWWSVAVGGASARLTCDICEPGRDSGVTADVAVGTWVAPTVAVGGEVGGWTHEEADVRERLARAGAVARWHPRPRGLHLLAGVGWSEYRADDFRYGAVHLSVGVGWDLPVSQRFSVGNRLVLDAASFGTLRNGDATVARGVGMSVARLSLSLRTR